MANQPPYSHHIATTVKPFERLPERLVHTQKWSNQLFEATAVASKRLTRDRDK
jgi:hypothetical protein